MKIKKAFTLIELLVAISIIAVITAVLLPNFMGMREKAKDSQRIQDINSVKNALRMYYNDNDSYPAEYSLLTSSLSNYMKDVDSAIEDCTYDSPDTHDTFVLRVDLDSKVGDEWKNSLVKCGVYDSVESLEDYYEDNPSTPAQFAVCAN